MLVGTPKNYVFLILQGAVFSVSFSEENPFLLAIGGSKGKLEVSI